MPLPNLMDHRQVAEELGYQTFQIVEAANSEELCGKPFPRPRIVELGRSDEIALLWDARDIARFGTVLKAVPTASQE